MNEEDAFLSAILANPGDSTPRLVYADWLDESSDEESMRRAEYLRVECELDSLPKDDRRRRRLREKLVQLRQTVRDEWWRALDYAEVDYCVEFEFQCEQRWDMLSPTSDPAVRHCSKCNRSVYYCSNTVEAYERADAGKCVAIDSRKMRLPLELLRYNARQGRLIGRVSPRVPQRIPLPLRGTDSPVAEDEDG